MSAFEIAFRLLTDAFAAVCLWRIAKRGIDSAMVAALKSVVEIQLARGGELSADIRDAEERIAELESAVFEDEETDEGEQRVPGTISAAVFAEGGVSPTVAPFSFFGEPAESISLDELGAKEEP